MEIVFTLEQIQQAAEKFKQAVGLPKVVAVNGPMGAGKTTFIKTFCGMLGVEDTVSSPTFSIINEYKNASTKIYHLDLYRLNSEEEAINAGVEDVLFSGYTCLVEWPEKAYGLLPDDAIQVHIGLVDSDTRKISFPS
jgi:tRNA threonylcarbamoyladenosine biosynthesis protein TsaE